MKDDVDIERDDPRAEDRPERRPAPKVVTRDGVAGVTRNGVSGGDRVRREREEEDKRAAEPVAPAEASEDRRGEREQARLFEADRSSELQRRWTDVQARFVDDPREAVTSADALVDEVIRDLSTLFSDERAKLESQWGKSDEVSTEDLRVALQRYRSFFERLLTI